LLTQPPLQTMLRRPPSRITLKQEDLEEYDEMMLAAAGKAGTDPDALFKERRAQAEEKARKEKAKKERIGAN